MSTATVRIHPEARERIEHFCAQRPGYEEGGIIIESDHSVCVTDSGPHAEHASDSLAWDTSYIFGCIEVAGALGGRVIGRWHSHTSPVILPSDEDKTSAAALRKVLGTDEIIDLIVATDAGKPIAWAAYLCSDAGYERVGIELPGEP